jgi:hypothetical protein
MVIKTMKKIGTIGLVFGLVLLNATALTAATPTVSYTFVSSAPSVVIDAVEETTVLPDEQENANDESMDDSSRIGDESPENGPGEMNPRSETIDESKKRQGIKFKGIWGFSEDNTTQGYVKGYLRRKSQHGILLGLWNKTGNEECGKIYGKFRLGYFAGRVQNPDGERCHIMGLYKIDKENHLLKMRWMTPHKDGWAVFRYIPPSEDVE